MRQVLVLIAALFIISGVAFAGAPALEVRALNGDVNADGAVDLGDVVSIRDHVLGVTPLAAPRFADFDRDGEVTLLDARDLLASVDPQGTKFAVRVHVESDPGGFSQIVEQEDLLRGVRETETDIRLDGKFDKAVATLSSSLFSYSAAVGQETGCIDCVDPSCASSLRTIDAWLIFNGDADDLLCDTGDWNATNVTAVNATPDTVSKSQQVSPMGQGGWIRVQYTVSLATCANFTLFYDISGEYSDDGLDCPINP
jgi:hypothetical protein